MTRCRRVAVGLGLCGACVPPWRHRAASLEAGGGGDASDRDCFRGDPVNVRDLALRIEARHGFRRCTWRKGTKQDLSARFAPRRVAPAGIHAEPDIQWLLIEWRDGETEPANYFLATLPEHIDKRQLIRIVMQRWRTERVYEDLKGELGLDHFEGRRFRTRHSNAPLERATLERAT